MVLFCGGMFSCVITLLVRTDRTKFGLWRVGNEKEVQFGWCRWECIQHDASRNPTGFSPWEECEQPNNFTKTLDFP